MAFLVVVVALVVMFPKGNDGLFPHPALATSNNDWPTLAHDMDRSGSTTTGPTGPYTEQWHRDLWSESSETISDGYQPVIVNDPVHNVNLVYVGTIDGVLYAYNLANGATFWRFPAAGETIGGILSPPTVSNGIVYLASLDGNVYAIDGTNVSNGTPATKWVFSTGRTGGFWGTPALDSTNLYVGARDGYVYAINLANGTKTWEYNTGAPILSSPAYDNGVVYIGSENMRSYALNVTNGSLIWQSGLLAGKTMRGSYPVVTSANVLFRTTPNDEEDSVLPEGEQVLAYADGCTSYPIVPSFNRSNAPCFNWTASASSQAAYTTESQAVSSYLSGAGYQGIPGRSQYETFFSLLRSNGTKPTIMPVLYTAGNADTTAPPVVDQSGRVWVLYKSYYSNYDEPNTYIMTTFGQLNPTSGAVTIRNPNPNPTGFTCDQYSCDPSSQTNVWMVADEQTAFSVAGTQLYTNQWSGLGMVDLNAGTLQSVAGDRDGFATYLDQSTQRVLPFSVTPPIFADANGPTIFGNTIVSHYNSIVVAFAGQIPGATPTVQPTATPQPSQTFTPTTAGPVTIPSQSSLQQYIWQVPTPINLDTTDSADLQATLNSQVSSFLSTGRLAPWIYIPGLQTIKAYFLLPSDTQYALGLAYPYLSPSLQSSVISYVRNEEQTLNPLTSTYPLTPGLSDNNGQIVDSLGQQRLPFPPGPHDFCALTGCEGQSPGQYWTIPQSFDRLYGVWAYAYRTGDWNWIQANWSNIKQLASVVDPTSDTGLLGICADPNGMNFGVTNCYWQGDDSANRRVSSLIALARIAYQLNDQTELTWATNTAELAMQARLRYVNNFRPSDGNGSDPTTSTWMTPANNGGLFVQRLGWDNTNIPQYRELTPEVAKLLSDYAGSDMARYDNFINVAYPGAYLQMGGNNFNGEVATTFPPNVQGIFLAKALASHLTGPQLRKYLDIPWVQEDLFYWERLVRTLDGYGTPATINLQNPSAPPVPVVSPATLPVQK